MFKILISDDSLSFRALVEKMLSEDSNNNYQVSFASNGREACTMAYHLRPDLILIDIDMPVMNGIEAIKKIKENNLIKRTPIIGMSSSKQFQEAVAAGANDFLMKPFDRYELIMRILLNLRLAKIGDGFKKQHELLKAQRQEAINQRDIILRQQKNLTDDLNYAGFVQNAILPSARDINMILKDHFIYNLPKYKVSGDFYWTARKNGLSMVAVGDCTGHGMSGALMTMAGVAFLNEIINSNDHFSADQILNDLRVKVIHLMNQRGEIGELSNGMDIAICVYDEATHAVQFAGANNPLYFVHKGGHFEEIKGDRMPIGFFFERDQPFTRKDFHISDGDTIYLFTDGYPDQFGGPFEKKFRYNQFRELIQQAAFYTSMEQQLELIKGTMDNWIEGYEQIDDMLVMGIRF